MEDAFDTAIASVVQQQALQGWQRSKFVKGLFAIKHLKHYDVEGREFIIFTYHKPLTFVFRQNAEHHVNCDI